MDATAALKPTVVQKLVDPFVDCGNLLLIDRDPLTELGSAEQLASRARDNTQLLFTKIWELEKKRIDEAIVAVLPKAVYRLPREKRIPDKKSATKWEQYARTKGIKPRKKRAKKILDEATGEWKPRFGFRRGNDNTKDWLIEVPGNKDPNTDLFEERRQNKKERVQKNELQRMRNAARQLKTKNTARLPSVDSAAASVGMGKEPTERTKQEIRVTADRAKFATASVGKFQDKLKNEKPNTKTGKKRKFEPNIGGATAEKDKNLEILKGVLSKRPKMLEHKMAETAGPATGEGDKKKAGKGGPRQKNAIHRQQHFQSKIKSNKKVRGNSRKDKK